jgi:toxin-antitoxin system PIN domain toxin
MTPDVNVLVAASRSDHPHHAEASNWLGEALLSCASGASFKLLPLVVASFLRLVTHPKIFKQPTPINDAVHFVDALLAVPGVDMPSVGAEWPSLRQLCLDRQLKANNLPDAWLAAAVVHMGEHLVTFDADFKKLLRPERVTLLHA